MTDIRTLMVQFGHEYGACERYLVQIASELHTSGFSDVQVALPDRPSLAPLSRDLRTSRVIVTPYDDRSRGLHQIWRIREILASYRPDILHLNEPHIPSILASLTLNKRPKTIVTHHTPELKRAYGWIPNQVYRGFPWLVDAIIYTSESDKSVAHDQYFGPGRSIHTVIPLAVPDEFMVSKVSREQHGIPTDGYVLGTVARLVPQKNIANLIAAVHQLHLRRRPVQLVVVGDGPLRNKLQRQAAANGLIDHIHFLGFRDDIGALLSLLDLFVMPSLFEGQCVAVTEALTAGIPVAATSVGGIPEQLNNGEFGVLIDNPSVEAIVTAIEWTMDNKDDLWRRARRGQKAVQVTHSRETMTEKTLDLYRATMDSTIYDSRTA